MSTPTTYSTVTKTFHWLTALLIIAIIPLGVIANDAPLETSAQLAYKAQLFSLHKTLGVTVFFVALLRILWALTQTKPGPLHPERKAETLLADIVHWVLYISLVAVPLTGWIEHAATSGFAPIWWPFGQSLPFVPQSEAVAGIFAGLHWMFGKLMVVSLLLHMAGALKHHFIDKDATLRRMWFGSKDMPAVGPHLAKATAPVLAVAVFAVGAGAAFALGLTDRHESTVAAAELQDVASDWTVTQGAIAIAVTQFGSTVSGEFADWTSQISFDPTPADVMGSVTTVVAIGSLTLGSVTAEALGSEYFNAEAFPTATFQADIKPQGDAYVADGTLTIKDISTPVLMPFELSIEGDTATMSGTTTLNRLDYNIGLTQNDEATLGFGVDVTITVTATKAAE